MAVHGLVVGIDEVGRGALAGPVVVAAVTMPHGLRFKKLKDSKKLSTRQREVWYAHFIANPKITFAVARVYPRQIEKRNISQAANLAAARAHGKLIAIKGNKLLKNHKTFLDGGLYLMNKKWQAANMPAARTIVKADENIPAVAIASIIAKVHRDRFMVKLAKQYPEYGFGVHKGYGTKIHSNALSEHGPCVVHRLTFIRKAATL